MALPPKHPPNGAGRSAFQGRFRAVLGSRGFTLRHVAVATYGFRRWRLCSRCAAALRSFPMPFSFMSWNVEHFRATPDTQMRSARVAAHIRAQDPDVFGLFEVETLDVIQLMQFEFPDYTFGITDGPQSQEILIGWRNGTFEQASFTQKREFDAHNEHLRPGALLSGRMGTVYYNLLYLHTDSGPDAAAFGNRFEMCDRGWKLRIALDRKVVQSGGTIGRASCRGRL